jgi:hypothetical protein
VKEVRGGVSGEDEEVDVLCGFVKSVVRCIL